MSIFLDYINVTENEINNLPNGVAISTMCASCNLNTILNISNIENYLELNTNDVLEVKVNDDNKRTLLIGKKKKDLKEKNKKTNHFYNQITVIIRITTGEFIDINKEPKINMKLFKNGSIQMSGCKNIYGVNIVLNKLVNKLKIIKAKFEDGKIIEKKFVDNIDLLNVTKFKIDMINSNYKVNIQIDRTKLYSLLNKKKIKCSYEPCIRACVIIKYTPPINNPESKEISIFIFQKGNIIITGARHRTHILSAYKYINDILLTHTDEICKKDEKDEEEIILKIYNSIIKENNKSNN